MRQMRFFATSHTGLMLLLTSCGTGYQRDLLTELRFTESRIQQDKATSSYSRCEHTAISSQMQNERRELADVTSEVQRARECPICFVESCGSYYRCPTCQKKMCQACFLTWTTQEGIRAATCPQCRRPIFNGNR